LAAVTTVTLIPRTDYDFSGVRSGRVSIPIVQRFDVAGALGLTLEVRMHEASFPDGSSAVVTAASDGFTPDDPGRHFLQTEGADGEAIGAVTLDASRAAPFFRALSVAPEDVGRMLAVLLEVEAGEQGGPRFSLSVELAVRDERAAALAGDEIEPVVVRPTPEQESVSGSALDRVRMAMISRRKSRYPRWNEIVV